MATTNHTTAGAQLQQLLADNAVAPTPAPAAEPAPDSLPVLSNFEWEETGEKPRKRGLPMKLICDELYTLTNGWPKRVGKDLFVPGAEHRPRYLETSAQLFAWLDARSFVDWGGASDMITPERLFAHLQETAEVFDAVEQYPHWPPLPNAYYMHPPLPETGGDYLDEFLDFFT